jgi:hypothetical protein
MSSVQASSALGSFKLVIVLLFLMAGGILYAWVKQAR